MFHRRLPRFRRAKASWRPPLTLQDRDIEFLRTVAESRILSTPQFLDLFPGQKDAVYRRLQLLFHHGYLDRLKAEPTEPMVYALAKRGADALESLGCLPEGAVWSKKNRDLGRHYVAHQTMVTNVRIALTLATAANPHARLLFFRRESDALQDRVQARIGGEPEVIPVRPDGFFCLQFPALPEGRNRAFFFVEADRSTMTRERFTRKLVGYWEWYRQGGQTRKLGIRSFRILTVTTSEERAASLLEAAARCPEIQEGLSHFWFAAESRFTSSAPEAILAPVWETPDAPGVIRQLPPRGWKGTAPDGEESR